MTHVYLTGIELSEFRTFEKLQIDLAPEPGVLIVHGSNGLGKSSLFDALEWTLTGDIDHFTSVDGYEKFGNYLCRWGGRTDPTTASLIFSDGTHIARRLEGRDAKVSTVSGVPSIAEYLRLPDWEAPISSLSRYLLLTHFLGQSSLSRLTHRKPGERLEILKEVSKSAALQKFGLALHGPGQTTPARAFAKRIGQLQKEAADLSDLLDQEEVLWSGAQASGALDDGDASKITGEIVQALTAVWQQASAARPPFRWDTLPDFGEVQLAIDQGAELIRDREFAISEARRLLALRDRHRKTLAESAGATELAEREVYAATALAKAARQEADSRREALAVASVPLTAAKRAHANALGLREAAVARKIARQEREQAEAELKKARVALDEAEQALQRSDRRDKFVARLGQEVVDLEQKIADVGLSVERGRIWLNRANRIEEAEVEARDLQESHSDIDAQIARASTIHMDAQAVESAVSEALRIVEASVGALSSAVSAIAANLPKDALDCPVCATHFPSNEELAARAGAAAERLAPLAVSQQRQVSEAKTAVIKFMNELERLRSVQGRQATLEAEILSKRVDNERVLLGLGLAAGSSRSDVERWLVEQGYAEERLATSRRVRARWLGRLAADGQAVSRASDAARLRDAALVAGATAGRRLDDCIVAERVSDDRFDALAMQLFPTEPPTHEQLNVAIADAAEAMAAAQKAYDDALNAASEQDLRLAPLQEGLVNLRARIAQAEASRGSTHEALEKVSSEWRALGWADENMEEAKIETAASYLNQARQSLNEAGALLGRLRDGREAWSRQMGHRAAFDRIRSLGDLAPNSTREQARAATTKMLQGIQEEIEATMRSKQIASAASDLIADAVNAFNAAYLDPLKLLTNRINQAIICDPRIGIGLKLQKRGIKQSASVAGEMPNDLDSVDPMLVHSEGQMAALAVSMLCAASLTYPWSRWRALILDDPLQHNDAIHAAAFADYISNMVRVKDYQVLLTTHDLSEAEFLQRKFGARNIPCAVLNLLGRGNNGVDWSFQPSSPSADDVAAIS